MVLLHREKKNPKPHSASTSSAQKFGGTTWGPSTEQGSWAALFMRAAGQAWLELAELGGSQSGGELGKPIVLAAVDTEVKEGKVLYRCTYHSEVWYESSPDDRGGRKASPGVPTSQISEKALSFWCAS